MEYLQKLIAPAVLISLVGGAATSGYIVGRSELGERLSIIEARVETHHINANAHHTGFSRDELVTRKEYEADKARIFESLGEIKALLAEMRRAR